MSISEVEAPKDAHPGTPVEPWHCPPGLCQSLVCALQGQPFPPPPRSILLLHQGQETQTRRSNTPRELRTQISQRQGGVTSQNKGGAYHGRMGDRAMVKQPRGQRRSCVQSSCRRGGHGGLACSGLGAKQQGLASNGYGALHCALRHQLAGMDHRDQLAGMDHR